MTGNINVQTFYYDWDEYRDWKNGDYNIREKLLGISGYLGQDRETYVGREVKGIVKWQKDQHYPEVSYAGYLVKAKGLERENIIYEKYKLSQKFIDTQQEKKNPDAIRLVQSYNLLRKVFSKLFFKKFSELCEKNRLLIKRKNYHKISVDLCAIDFNRNAVNFVEIKRCDPGPICIDRFKPDQQLFMEFIHDISDKVKEKAFSDKPFRINTSLVIFIPEGDILTTREPMPIEFNRLLR